MVHEIHLNKVVKNKDNQNNKQVQNKNNWLNIEANLASP